MENKDITFVVQGPVRERTMDTLESIRNNFKGSKIILSTWEGSRVDNLSYDSVVYSKDPGEINITKNNHIVGKENTNRQIVSTHSGLLNVQTKYAVKIRTDTPILSNAIIELYYKAQDYYRDPAFSFLEERVIVSSINTIDPNSYIKFPYHISDWFFFGKTTDLLKIWNGKIIPEDEYFTEQDIQEKIFCSRGFDFGRFTAEQLVLYYFLKNNGVDDHNYFCDVSDNKIERSIKCILANFYCSSPKKMGLFFLKYEDLIRLKFNFKSFRRFMGFYLVTINESVWRDYYKSYYGLRTTITEKIEIEIRKILLFCMKRIKKKK